FASASTTVTGCVTATGTTTTTGTPVNTSTTAPLATATTTPTFTTSNLFISKTHAPNPVNPGQFFAYTITISNLNFASVPNVAFTDALPAGVTYQNFQDVSGTGFQCNAVGNQVTCASGTVPGTSAAGGQNFARVNLLVVADNPCVAISPLRNNAQLNPQGYQGTQTPGPTSVTDLTDVNTCITATGTVTATRTNTPVTPTSTFTSTATVTNTATATATPSVDLVITKMDAPDPVPNPGGGVNGGDMTY